MEEGCCVCTVFYGGRLDGSSARLETLQQPGREVGEASFSPFYRHPTQVLCTQDESQLNRKPCFCCRIEQILYSAEEERDGLCWTESQHSKRILLLPDAATMPVIVLEASDFTNPLFLVRMWEVLSGSVTIGLVASLKPPEKHGAPEQDHWSGFKILCMFTWCFFFSLTLLIHILSIIQFHNLIPISWKNLSTTAAVLGTFMSFSACVFFCWIIMDHASPSAHSLAAAVAACLTVLAYASESYIICIHAGVQRGYMGSMSGLLKLLQLWGSCQMIALVVEVVCELPNPAHVWQRWLSGVSYGICILMSLATLVVLLGDFAGRCPLPFDKFLSGFSLVGVLLYMVTTVISFTKISHLKELDQIQNSSSGLVIMETVVSSITLLAYTVDLAFSIKLLCDRSH